MSDKAAGQKVRSPGVAIKVGRRLHRASVTFRSRYGSSTGSSTRIALPAVHFPRNPLRQSLTWCTELAAQLGKCTEGAQEFSFATFPSQASAAATESQKEMVAPTDSLTNAVCTTDMVLQTWEVFRVRSQWDPVVSMESIYGDPTTGLNNFFPKSPTLRAIPPISLIMVICRTNSLNLVRSLAPSPFSTAMSRCRYFL
jgi:hypothetical protein